jgi:hypothetical protein
MKEIVTFTNASGESIVFSNQGTVYRLYDFNMKPAKSKAITKRGYRQDGETYKRQNGMPRDFILEFCILGSGYSDMFQKRREVKRIMSQALDEGKVKYQNDYFTTGVEIDVKIDEEPEFGTDKNVFGFHSQIGVISMTAYYPYWRDLTYTQIGLVGLSGGFFWETPTYFDGAFYVGEVAAASQIVTNSGDVPAPLEITWQGVSEDPKITLEDTGEFILLNKTLDSDTRLHIYTAYGNKIVYVETISTGELVKNNSLIDPTSTFFSLPVGNSTISLSATSGAASAAVELKYKNLYSGV